MVATTKGIFLTEINDLAIELVFDAKCCNCLGRFRLKLAIDNTGIHVDPSIKDYQIELYKDKRSLDYSFFCKPCRKPPAKKKR